MFRQAPCIRYYPIATFETRGYPAGSVGGRLLYLVAKRPNTAKDLQPLSVKRVLRESNVPAVTSLGETRPTPTLPPSPTSVPPPGYVPHRLRVVLLCRPIETTKKTPWAHLDIAGPVWSFEGGGATGYGVRLLTRWVQKKGE